MSPVHRHNDALVTGEAERPRNARVWDTHAQPPAAVEPARPTSSFEQRSITARRARPAGPAARRVESRSAPARAARTRAVSLTRVIDELSGVRSRRRRDPIPFGISPDVWARLTPDTQRTFRALARRIASVLR